MVGLQANGCPSLRALRMPAKAKSRTHLRRHRDGHEFPVEVSARLSTLHGQRCVVSSNRDVSEQELAEQRLLEQQRRLELAARSSNIGFWDWDLVTVRSIVSKPCSAAELNTALRSVLHQKPRPRSQRPRRHAPQMARR